MSRSPELPVGFGIDPSVTAVDGRLPGEHIDPPAAESSASIVVAGNGPSTSPFDSGTFHGSVQTVSLSPDSFHIDAPRDPDEPPVSSGTRPQSLLITTALVGILLAALGYFTGFR